MSAVRPDPESDEWEEPGSENAGSEGAASEDAELETWHLRLYVAGESSQSLQAFANLKQMCDEHLDHPYEIEIVDLLKNPKLARGDEIIAIPTLVRRLPAPMRKIIGDLSDTDRVLVGLQLLPKRAT